MQSSWRIFSVFGIDIYLHASFLLFLLILAFFDFSLLPFLFILFTIICLHEISHSLVAKVYKIKVSRIMLLPIGGMAIMKEGIRSPFSEFLIAIAGPFFNLVLSAVFFIAFKGHILGWYAWNTIVGAASVITKDIPPGVVVVGRNEIIGKAPNLHSPYETDEKKVTEELKNQDIG